MCLSQTTFDSTEVKTIALIFAEHEKLSNENIFLKEEINSLEELTKLYSESDSIQNCEIELYKNKVESDAKEIKRLKSSKKATILGSGLGGIVLFIIGLLL